jgi:predicted nucleotidyltransferase component of viral defense system
MIPGAHITAWRAHAPWASDAQVEQDLVLSRAIVEIFRHPLLGSTLIFRGGTALHKVVLAPAARYSEDIDLVQATPGPIGPVMSALRESLDPWLGKPKREQTAAAVRFIYRFNSEAPPSTPLRLKVEINTREHLHVLPIEDRPFAVENPWFTGRSDLRIFALEELLGTKLRALYQRKKGRDLFDLATTLARVSTTDPGQIARCFGAYMAAAGQRVSRAEFEENLAAKLDDPAFTGDIGPLLAPGIEAAYDVADAGAHVGRDLVSLLPGEPWKGPGAPRAS